MAVLARLALRKVSILLMILSAYDRENGSPRHLKSDCFWEEMVRLVKLK